MEKAGQRDDTPQMTAAQAAQYKAQYEAAKAQWAKMTPEQQKATIAAARQKKLQDLSAIELVGQRDDMQKDKPLTFKEELDTVRAQLTDVNNKLAAAQTKAQENEAALRKQIDELNRQADDYRKLLTQRTNELAQERQRGWSFVRPAVLVTSVKVPSPLFRKRIFCPK